MRSFIYFSCTRMSAVRLRQSKTKWYREWVNNKIKSPDGFRFTSDFVERNTQFLVHCLRCANESVHSVGLHSHTHGISAHILPIRWNFRKCFNIPQAPNCNIIFWMNSENVCLRRSVEATPTRRIIARASLLFIWYFVLNASALRRRLIVNRVWHLHRTHTHAGMHLAVLLSAAISRWYWNDVRRRWRRAYNVLKVFHTDRISEDLGAFNQKHEEIINAK